MPYSAKSVTLQFYVISKLWLLSDVLLQQLLLFLLYGYCFSFLLKAYYVTDRFAREILRRTVFDKSIPLAIG